MLWWTICGPESYMLGLIIMLYQSMWANGKGKSSCLYSNKQNAKLCQPTTHPGVIGKLSGQNSA